MLGVSLANRYASLSADWPSTYPRVISRSSPVMRESAVPPATTTLLRSSPLIRANASARQPADQVKRTERGLPHGPPRVAVLSGTPRAAAGAGGVSRSVRWEQDAVDHVDHAVGRLDVGGGHVDALDGHGAVGDGEPEFGVTHRRDGGAVFDVGAHDRLAFDHMGQQDSLEQADVGEE